MTNYLPRYFSQKAIIAYLLLLALVTIGLNKPIPVLWGVMGISTVILFFVFTNRLTKRWNQLPTQTYEKLIFFSGLGIRLVYVLVSYWFYTTKTGIPFEFDAADSQGYHAEAIWVRQMLTGGNLTPYFKYIGQNYSDMGYPFFLGFIYYLFDDSILMARIIKAVLSSVTCFFVYRLASRAFGESVGRMAGVMSMLLPNLIYYCGIHTKETEMVFLTVMFFERADYLLRAKSFSLVTIAVVTVLGISLFFFRTVLGATALFSLSAAIVINSQRIVKLNRRFGLFIWCTVLILLMAGGNIEKELKRYKNEYTTNQLSGLKYKSERKGGNRLAIYGSGALFAPIILIAPFPTLINIETQQNQMLLNGGYFIRNALAFFIIFAIFLFIKKKELTRYTLLLTFVASYLAILLQSTFALSERFHMPILPFLIILAAYGISQAKIKHKRNYFIYLIFVGVIILGWNWFKIAGRA